MLICELLAYFSSNDNLLSLIPPTEEPDVLNDIDTGWWYINSWKKLHTDVIDLPFPMNIFLDKAHVSGNKQFSIETVTLQSAFAKRHIWYKLESFCNLGNMTKLNDKFYYDTQTKIHGYHTILACILEDFKKESALYQGYLWVMEYSDKKLDLVCICPYTHSIICNTSGYNLICAKMNGSKTTFECQYCMCPKEKVDDLTKEFHPLMPVDYLDLGNKT